MENVEHNHVRCPTTIEHNIHMEELKIEHEIKQDDIWRSCCLDTDQFACKFIIQASFAFIVFIFAAFQLTRSDDCNHTQPYLGIITFILGAFIPKDLFTKKDK